MAKKALEVVIPNGWDPRWYQMPMWQALTSGKKRAIAIWHRRAGKDDVCLHWAALSAMQRVGNYWHMLPEASQARKAIWDAINPHTGKKRIDEAFPLAIRKRTSNHEMLIEFINGATWQVLGSDNYNSLVGSPPVGVVFSEYALADPSAWAYIRPILAENNGWALFITTARGRNHAHSLYEYAKTDPENWFAEKLPVDYTKAVEQHVLDREFKELTAERGQLEADAIIQQEWYCSFDAAIPGTYYAYIIERLEREGFITSVPYNPLLPVGTAWDIGFGDSTAIWFFQVVGREVRIFDYYEMSGVDVFHYAKMLRDKQYSYFDHILPHDAGHGNIRSAGGKSFSEILRGEGFPNRVIERDISVDVGIQATRTFLPQCVFDAQKCSRGIEAVRQYRRIWDKNRRCYNDAPYHDWTSHASDALRALARGFRAPNHAAVHNRQKIQVIVGDYLG